MIYATEQQVVVTSGIVVVVGLVALCIGIWWGIGRGWREAEEDARWAREQARARRTHPVYQQGPARPLFERAGMVPPEAVQEEPETVLMPSAMLSPEEASWTGEIKRMTADFERDMERMLAGTDGKLREITR